MSEPNPENPNVECEEIMLFGIESPQDCKLPIGCSPEDQLLCADKGRCVAGVILHYIENGAYDSSTVRGIDSELNNG